MKIVYVDMDGVVADYDAHKHLTIEHDPELSESKVPKGYFENLPLISGAKDAINILKTKYDLHILSTPQWSNPNCWSEKRIWIENHFGDVFFKKVTLTHNKGLLMGDYLIDDSLRNGVKSFKGEHIHFGSKSFPNWYSVVDYLMSVDEAENNIKVFENCVT